LKSPHTAQGPEHASLMASNSSRKRDFNRTACNFQLLGSNLEVQLQTDPCTNTEQAACLCRKKNWLIV
jgi:hypothetical protein